MILLTRKLNIFFSGTGANMNTIDNQFIQTPPAPPVSSSKKWVWWVVGTIGGCLILSCCIALIAGIVLYSQGKFPFSSGLNPDSTPINGEGSLATGFSPDPYTTSISGEGTIDASKITLEPASGCVGYVTKAPTFNLNWTGPTSTLRFFTVANSGTDTTMIVRDPSGNYYCNDDAGDGGWDPMVDILNARTGKYNIWLGSYSSGGSVSASLYITEQDFTPLNPTGINTSESIPLDLGATPTYGSVDLAGGFSPDPFEIAFVGGGSVDITSANLGPDCTGYTASIPDFRINFSGSASRLRIFFVSDSGSDTTLIVNDPNTNWFCNDDFTSGSGDPLVDIPNPAAGQIDIWVGTYSSGEYASGTLYVTGMDFSPTDIRAGLPGGTGTLDYNLDPTYGSATIGDNSSPDPFSVEVLAGGTVDISTLALGPGCTGFAAVAPDFRFNYTGTASHLRVFYIANDGSDGSLIINAADTNWYCNDDDLVSATTNPMIEISSPQTGQYDVWVATAGTINISGILYVTEQDYNPSLLP
jgi:hypothetical protein